MTAKGIVFGNLLGTILFGRVADWRANVIFVGFGWALYQLSLLRLHRHSVPAYIDRMPWEVLLLSLCGILFLVFGFRLILLFVCSIAAAFQLRTVMLASHPRLNQVAEEYLLYFIVPFVGLIIASIFIFERLFKGRGLDEPDSRRELGDRICDGCKVILVTTLGFVTLAKINTDFFNPETSCMMLSETLKAWWSLPDFVEPLMEGMTPRLFVFLEGMIILLLYLWAPVGIIFTVMFTQGLANIGPTAFNATIVCLTLSFLQYSDRDHIIKGIKESWKVLVLIVAVLIPISYGIYDGSRPWHQFGIYHIVSLVIVFCSVLLIIARLEIRIPDVTKSNRGQKRAVAMGHAGVRRSKIHVVFLGVLIAGLLLNGFSPYLGLKHRLSFAMLSNLRVDNNRWNHFFIPEEVYLFQYDPYIRVHEIRSGPAMDRPHGDGRISRVMYSPREFKRRIEMYMKEEVGFSISFEYKGRLYSFEDAELDATFLAFVNELCENRWFQRWLYMDGPQHCVH